MSRSATALHSVMTPPNSRTINPSVMQRTTDRSRSSLARNAAAAVARSAVTAARISELTAAVARNS